ncbi:hypothetical protein R3P38DRAFT_3270916 [Favolaschia claudopus]|uniref:Uncharacterized protein n=1 Tax=Favolaschia claudopus TaxID=2862362 RepID=A0AAW0BCG7_9AGAR
MTDADDPRGFRIGSNRCNSTTENQDSLCQTIFVNHIDDWCVWAALEFVSVCSFFTSVPARCVLYLLPLFAPLPALLLCSSSPAAPSYALLPHRSYLRFHSLDILRASRLHPHSSHLSYHHSYPHRRSLPEPYRQDSRALRAYTHPRAAAARRRLLGMRCPSSRLDASSARLRLGRRSSNPYDELTTDRPRFQVVMMDGVLGGKVGKSHRTSLRPPSTRRRHGVCLASLLLPRVLPISLLASLFTLADRYTDPFFPSPIVAGGGSCRHLPSIPFRGANVSFVNPLLPAPHSIHPAMSTLRCADEITMATQRLSPRTV